MVKTRTVMVVAAVGISFLGGCANAPKISEVGYIDQKAAGTAESATAECKAAGVAAPDRTDLKQLNDAIPCRINHFNAQWQQTESDQWGNTWLTDYGTGLAIASVAAHATPYAIGFASVVALAQANDKIDGPAKQGVAWQKAGHAYQCIKGYADPLAADKDFLHVKVGSPDSSDEAGDVYAARVMYGALLKVDYMLQDRLRIDAVTTPPDWNSIMAQAKIATQPAPVAEPETLTKSQTEAEKAKAKADKERADKLAAKLGSFKKDLDTCVAAN